MPDDTVKVVIRCRPFNQKEANEGASNVIETNNELAQIKITPPANIQKQARSFTFDAVYGTESKNIDIFNISFRPLVSQVLEGYNACIFAYGQTGSGKTFTMSGVSENPGCIPNSFQYLFDTMSTIPNTEFLVSASFIEIYNEEVRDLMTGKAKLAVRENPKKGIYIEGLKSFPVKSEKEIIQIMDQGTSHRTVAATKMNATSSRSHSIFMVRVERLETISDKETVRCGKLNLVDLAGSERQGKTGAEGKRLQEANSINLSLSTLGIVIQKLVQNSPHIPYRDSILTRLLQESLGGNSKTLMVANLNPASTNYEETLSTLRYADQAKKITNKAVINEDPKDAQIRIMRDRIAELTKAIQEASSGEMTREKSKKVKNLFKKIQQIKEGVDNCDEVEEIVEEIIEIEGDTEQLEKLNQLQRQKESLENLTPSDDQQLSKEDLIKLKEELLSIKSEIVSSDNLETQQRETERKLREARAKIAERKERENIIQRELQKRQEQSQKTIQNTFTQEQQIEELKRQIEGKKTEIRQIEQDIDDEKMQNSAKIDEIVEQRRRFDQESSLFKQIATLLIPPFHFKKISAMITYDDEAREFRKIIEKKEVNKRFIMDALELQVEFPGRNGVPRAIHQEIAEQEAELNLRMNLEPMGLDEPERITIGVEGGEEGMEGENGGIGDGEGMEDEMYDWRE
ncbi:Kinesin-like protein [Spironucleus salmonicida]|uniref:Kinesin-like protein n=1 Tax=Spironucleus salmonicida TaxID=348837 RepID=V6LLA7_9EUKA|nr:Kinesin-like protein [Spironucleus salmonicida]|eukprot:EST45420.1 Kinesin-2 [Spironucleus salmonicida]